LAWSSHCVEAVEVVDITNIQDSLGCIDLAFDKDSGIDLELQSVILQIIFVHNSGILDFLIFTAY
jgi:hypothetical protein